MEASERVVEAYMRVVEKCLTIANVKCKNNKEIDLLAIDRHNNKFHIETTISTSALFSKITDKEISKGSARTHAGIKAHYRRTASFFINDKFNDANVLDGLRAFGFEKENYKKVIVSWGATNEARDRLTDEGIEVWNFPDMLTKLFEATARSGYLSDEERIFQLIGLWIRLKK